MDKMNYPRGLIDYTSENTLEGKKSKLLRPRTLGYAAFMMIMVGAVIYTVLNRNPIDVDAIRDRGSLFTTTSRGTIENSYILKLMNKSPNPREFHLKVIGLNEPKVYTSVPLSLDPFEVLDVPTTVEIDPATLKGRSTEIQFVITASDDETVKAVRPSRYLGPAREHEQDKDHE